jgi:hypothetical protein
MCPSASVWRMLADRRAQGHAALALVSPLRGYAELPDLPQAADEVVHLEAVEASGLAGRRPGGAWCDLEATHCFVEHRPHRHTRVIPAGRTVTGAAWRAPCGSS